MRRHPISTRTDTLLPDTTVFRSGRIIRHEGKGYCGEPSVVTVSSYGGPARQDVLRLQRCEVVIHLADETSVKEFHVIIEQQNRLVLRQGREGPADVESPVLTGIDHLEIDNTIQTTLVAHYSKAAHCRPVAKN